MHGFMSYGSFCNLCECLAKNAFFAVYHKGVDKLLCAQKTKMGVKVACTYNFVARWINSMAF